MSLTDDFARAVEASPVDLETAALLIGAHGDHTADLDAARREMDAWAQRVPDPSVEALVATLLGDDGLAGDRETYYDPRNSYLHAVLERRRGIPISLAVVTAAVGGRIGVELHGVGTPGHFVLRTGASDPTFVDAFDGRLYRRDGLLDFFARAAPGVDVAPYLGPLAPTDVIRRMLNNLVNAFRQRGERDGLVWSTQLRTLLPGAAVSEHRAFGGALAAAGDFARAAKVLEAVADDGGGSGDGGRSGDDDLRAEAQRLRARLN